MQKAWSSIEEVPYCVLVSSIKFQGHTAWKIADLNPIWVRLLGRSQLSNPPDLPCFIYRGVYFEQFIAVFEADIRKKYQLITNELNVSEKADPWRDHVSLATIKFGFLI